MTLSRCLVLSLHSWRSKPRVLVGNGILSLHTSHRPATSPALLLLLLTLAILVTGCASVKEGSDPVVVNAERTLSFSFEAIDGFLRLEHQHRGWTRTNTPHVHAIAESLRKTAPKAFSQAHGAVKAYKRNRTPEAKAQVGATVAEVQRLGAQATSGLAQLNPPSL